MKSNILKGVVLTLALLAACLLAQPQPEPEVLVIHQTQPPPIGWAASTFRPCITVLIHGHADGVVGYRVRLDSGEVQFVAVPTAKDTQWSRHPAVAVFYGELPGAKVYVQPLTGSGPEVVR
jgi:hypothetical protein